jgi:hypothetical protein
MVGDRYTLMWPEDQVALAPTGASIRGSPARVGVVDRGSQTRAKYPRCARTEAREIAPPATLMTLFKLPS